MSDVMQDVTLLLWPSYTKQDRDVLHYAGMGFLFPVYQFWYEPSLRRQRGASQNSKARSAATS
jgi:hypothetical protein